LLWALGVKQHALAVSCLDVYSYDPGQFLALAQGARLRNDLYCVEWDVKLYYTIPYHTIFTTRNPHWAQTRPSANFFFLSFIIHSLKL